MDLNENAATDPSDFMIEFITLGIKLWIKECLNFWINEIGGEKMSQILIGLGLNRINRSDKMD